MLSGGGGVAPSTAIFRKGECSDFYDFEVFKEDWLAVFIDVTKKKNM